MSELFTLNENNEIEYNGEILEDNTLFNLDEEQILDSIDVIEQAASSAPELAVPVAEDPEVSTGGDTVVYNVYAVPSDSTGYPNANSLNYLEDVVRSYPLDYDYVCFRTDDQYAQSMILYIGDDATVSGNRIHFDECDVINLDYRYENYNNSWLNREFYQDTNVDITLGSSTLAYTNMIPGYAAFDVTTSHKTSNFGFVGILVGVFAFVVLLRLIGGSKNV